MNAADIVKLLRERYPMDKGFVSLSEVSPPGGAGRYDFVAVSIWASHGYHVDGFEIKVARSDFLAEVNNPSKSSVLAKWCDRWWMVAPAEVGSADECPLEWGFLSVSKEGDSLRQVRRAKSIEHAERGDKWWATLLLRQATRDRFAPDDLQKATDEGYDRGHQAGMQSSGNEVVRLRERLEEATTAIREFEVASGIRINGWHGPKRLGECVDALLRGNGFDGVANTLERTSKDLANIAESLKALKTKEEQVQVGSSNV